MINEEYARINQSAELIAANTGRVLFENSHVKFTMGDLLSGIESMAIRNLVAMCEHNTRTEFDKMDEGTKMLNVGSFEKFAFPMVRQVLPSLVAHELVSVQAMAGPVSQVFFMKFLYNVSKGSAVAGTDMIENPNSYYSSESIDLEVIGAGDGATVAFTPSTAFIPIKPGSLRITATISAAESEVLDNGNGALTGAGLAANGTVNYSTGALSFTFSTAPDLSTDIECSYSYDMEANSSIPEVDLSLTSAPVVATPRKLRAKWSLEAAADFKSQHGLDAEMELVSAISNEIKFEIDQEIIRDLRNLASNTLTPAWSATPGAGISYTEHKLSFSDQLIEASNLIFSATGRATGTWVVAAVNVCNIIESLPGFRPTPNMPKNIRGVYKVGRLDNRWDIFKDSNYAASSYLVGYKGDSMLETGYVYAPYVPMYTTGMVPRDDFQGSRGIASRYGKKMVDGKFYCKGTISA